MTKSEINIEEIRTYLLILQKLNSLEASEVKKRLYLRTDQGILKCIQKYQSLQPGVRYNDFFPLREYDFVCEEYINGRIKRQLEYYELLIRLDKNERKRLRLAKVII